MAYIFLATFFNAAYHTLQRLAGPLINSFLGAFLVELSALILAASFLVRNKNANYELSGLTGLIFVILVGVATFGIDYFSLKAYSKGVELSVGGPIIVGGTILLTAAIGLILLGEEISFLKILGILFALTGCLFLLKS